MNFILLVPKVVQSFRARFPATANNAYSYFNYDNRVVDERVNRHDDKRSYKTPDDLSDEDYQDLVNYASTIVDPCLSKYSKRVAFEDALSLAVRDFRAGMYDGKVNANRFEVLLQSMMCSPVMAAKKKEDPEKRIHPGVLRQLGLKQKDVPRKERLRQRERKQDAPIIYKTKGKTVLKKAESENGPSEYMLNFLEMIPQLPTQDMEVVRRLVGRWGQAKKVIKDFLQEASENFGLDKDYVDRVSEDFDKASKILERLEKLYSSIKDFDMEDIKTYLEPLITLADKAGAGSESDVAPEEGASEVEIQETEESIEPKEGSMIKNAKDYTERLDKVAEEVQNIDPNIAMQIDMISDVIEGRKEATSLKWDPDESRYMANRFDYRVRSREADEPYVDEFNKSNFEQVMREKKNPQPVRKASVPYTKLPQE